MSAEVVVREVGKSYRQWDGEWRRMLSWFVPGMRPRQESWVLRNVSFRVGPGEVVGIVGQNGAGKSTLLKMIVGTTQPTEGTVSVTGRVGAILELGMGFNPEATGRQNAAHAAGLMGLSQAQIAAAMPEIEDFAELGDYFDAQLRTYSSGMQMRLAFSVSTAIKPDLLIIDEALSVGDIYFQHKSFDRIRRFKAEGVSILFVTHGMGDVRTLCDRAVLLDKGRMVRDGQPDEVLDYYNALIAERENAKLTVEQQRDRNGWLVTRSGNGHATIESLRMLDLDGAEIAVCAVGQQVVVRAVATLSEPVPRLVAGLMIRDKMGHVVWGSNTAHTQQALEDVPQGATIRLDVPFTCTLGPGSYAVTVALTSSESHATQTFDWIDNFLVFEVVNLDRPHFVGSSWLDARFMTERAA
jgi:lipopolysaccharide transport system ATP-binding protein